MSQKSERTNISIAPRIREMAETLMQARAFSDFSGFLAQLIREEWERRHGPMMVPDANAPTPIQSTASPKEIAAAIAAEALEEVVKDSQATKPSPRSKRG